MSVTIQRGLGIAIASILGAAHAQEARSQTSVLEEIVVTAQKREEKLQDVPIAVTVVSAEQLDNQRVYTINDLARTAPSLEMIQAFGGPGGGGQIRGIGTQTFSRTAEGAVGIVVDGVPQGNVNISNIFDMQRVEVLRGPQGTLFGLTSSAGVINMVTQPPKFGEFEGKIQLDYSDNGTMSSKFGQQTVRAALNIPLSDSQALRISATGDNTTGVQRNETTRSDNESEDYSIRARYRLKTSDAFDANFIVDFSKRTQDFADPQFTYVYANPALTARLAACGITPSFENRSRCPAIPTKDERKNYGASLQLDIGIGEHTLTSISAFRKNTGGPSDFDIKGLASESTQIRSIGQTSSAYQLSQELRIANPSGSTVEYLAGLFYSDYNAKGGVVPGGAFQVRVTVPFPPFLLIPVNQAQFTETSNESLAAFGQMTYHLTDRLGLIVGARFTHQELEDFSSGNIYAAPPVPLKGSLEKDNVSGRVGLQYKFNPDLTGYATAVRGYKGPQVTPASQGNDPSIIGPEIPTAFELGLKGALAGGHIGFDANVFYTDVKDYQGQRYRINSTGVLVATPESIPSVVTKGIEVSMYGQPLEGLMLNAGAIYNLAEYPNGWTGYNPNDLRDPVPGNTTIGRTNLSREQIVGVPKTKLNFSADYNFALGELRAFIGADTVYKSDLRLGPTADSRFIFPAGWNTGARLGIGSAADTWSVTLFGRNLSDRNEPVTLFGGPSFTPPAPTPGFDPANPNGYVNGVSGWVTAASLRQVGVTVDVKF